MFLKLLKSVTAADVVVRISEISFDGVSRLFNDLQLNLKFSDFIKGRVTLLIQV
jgi:hypothetical protein